MKKVSVTVNISFKYPATDKKLSAIIKSGKPEKKYLPHIFALFADVPTADLLAFAAKSGIGLPDIKKFYSKHVKKYYPNHELEGILAGK